MAEFKTLPFDVQDQQGDFWCWAATSASISLFYNKNSSWTQCKIACTALKRVDCCPAVRRGPCDKTFFLDEALIITKNFVEPLIEHPMTFNDIRKEIDENRLIGVRIRWQNGDGH